jgi:hypothetical protein
MMNLPKCLILTLASTGLAAFAQAQITAVAFYSTDTNSPLAARTTNFNIDLDGDSVNNDSRVFFGFNNPGDAAWSSNTTGNFPYALYGGFMAESYGNPTRNLGTYALGAGGFALRYQPDSAGESGRLTTALVFEASRDDLSFDSNSFMRIGGGNVWQTDANLGRFDNLGSARWLVRNGSTYYVSETLVANSVDGRLLSGAEIAATNWAVYNPADAYAFNLNLNFNVASSTFEDLNAFGIMTYKTAIDTTRSWLEFTQFEVVAVPEPSTYAALFGLFALACVALRRRLRK